MCRFYKVFTILCFLLFCFSFISHSLSAEITTEEDFNSLTTYYYLNPQPDKIPQAIGYFLSSKLFRDNIDINDHVIEMVSYFFGRIANINPNLLREYEKFYDSEDMHGKLFLITVFAIASDEQNKDFFRQRLSIEKDNAMKNLLEEIINTPPLGNKRIAKGVRDYNDLDFLWMEFFVTGDKELIIKLIDVLSWEDRFRDKLMKWISVKHSKKEIKRLNDLLNNEVGISVDLDRFLINYDFDLDCIFSAYLQRSGSITKRSKHGIEIRKILDLSEEDIFYMATKGAAMWALQSNAKQHKRVLEYCKQEFKQRNDKSKIELAIILELASKGSLECIPTEKEGIITLKLSEENNQ